MKKKKSKKGFASMDANIVKEIARLGGLSTSKNREHMIAIGRKGGIASGVSRQPKTP